jgi:hypothetical protein
MLGVVMAINFVAYWAVPIAGMGMLYKFALAKAGRPLFELFDNMPLLRSFASTYVYQKERYSDYFFISLLTAVSIVSSFAFVLRWQIQHGALPWWLVFAYYCMWVGLGGRSMGTAYTMAHKEGHNVMLYQKWWRNSIGNLFENRLGMLYGNVPYNFQVRPCCMHARAARPAARVLTGRECARTLASCPRRPRTSTSTTSSTAASATRFICGTSTGRRSTTSCSTCIGSRCT